jgi:serine/threonine protein kinase/tetratricopeptide (TPR) repeat protein
MIGQILGHYRILEKVAAGGMGVVYLAHDEQLERDVAVKVLPSGTLADDAARSHFRREAMALAKLNHPHIETVYDFGTQNDIDFLVMEYVPGKTLADRLSVGAFPEKEIIDLAIQIASALEEAHERGIVHRDLKPANIAFTAKGYAKILDFGLARLLRPVEEGSTEVISDSQAAAGTLPYMPPEQLRGERVDGRADIYTVGAVLYEMATCRRVFREELASLLIDAILHQPVVPPRALNPRVSPGLETIILKCLDREANRRYQTAKELLVDLRRLQVEPSGTALPTAPHPDAKVRQKWIAYSATAALTLVAVLIAFNVADWRNRLLGRALTPQIRSLAVLPLENLSGDPAQEYFADGMTDALITDLGEIGALRVISRTSVMQYKGGRKPLRDIAKSLGVDAAVEGSILRSGGHIQITARLIQAKTDTRIWSQTYERDIPDALKLQSEVAQAIADEIRIKLTPEEKARIKATHKVNPEAFDSYLKGRHFWEERTEEGLKKSLKYFRQALDEDPAYARAYAGLADSYATLGNNRFLPPNEAFPEAKAAALKSLEIDPDLAEPHASLAFSLWNYDLDWDAVEKEYKRAIELNPGYPTAYHWYSGYLSGMGRHAEAIAAIKKARELDPLSPRINANVGLIFYFAHEYDQAIEELQKALQMDPNSAAAYFYLGMVLSQKGEHQQAISALEKSRQLLNSSPESVLELAFANAVAGKPKEAREMLGQLMGQANPGYIPALWVARIYAALSEKDKAFQWLQKAYEERSPQLPFLKVDPRLDTLRADPRFQDLLRRMKLQSYAGSTLSEVPRRGNPTAAT